MYKELLFNLSISTWKTPLQLKSVSETLFENEMKFIKVLSYLISFSKCPVMCMSTKRNMPVFPKVFFSADKGKPWIDTLIK